MMMMSRAVSLAKEGGAFSSTTSVAFKSRLAWALPDRSDQGEDRDQGGRAPTPWRTVAQQVWDCEKV